MTNRPLITQNFTEKICVNQHHPWSLKIKPQITADIYLIHRNPQSSVVVNGCTDTYCALDNVQEFTYDELTKDFYGTPGEMDKRVTNATTNNVVCITSALAEEYEAKYAATTKNVVCITSIFEHDDNVLRDKYKNVYPIQDAQVAKKMTALSNMMYDCIPNKQQY